MSPASNGAVSRPITLSTGPPMALDELLAFLALRAIPGVEEVSQAGYRRTTQTGSGQVVVSIRPGPGTPVSVEIVGGGAGIRAVTARARHLFDLDADSTVIDTHLQRAPTLASLVAARPGLRVPGAFDPFETGVRAILGQQVSVKGASTLTGRLAEELGTPLPQPDGSLTTVFPGAAVLADADLAGLGVPSRRACALSGFARAVADGTLRLDSTASANAVRAGLIEIPGIGPWTSEYICMRVLHDRDAFPSSDLGLLKAAAELGIEGSLIEASNRWRPYRAYAAMHLWRSLDPA